MRIRSFIAALGLGAAALGLSACAQIRSEPSTAHIPIIMVTTRGEEQSIETAFRNGCNDYVTKPINGLELMTKLQNVLDAAVVA